jgi:hypothetical protein
MGKELWWTNQKFTPVGIIPAGGWARGSETVSPHRHDREDHGSLHWPCLALSTEPQFGARELFPDYETALERAADTHETTWLQDYNSVKRRNCVWKKRTKGFIATVKVHVHRNVPGDTFRSPHNRNYLMSLRRTAECNHFWLSRCCVQKWAAEPRVTSCEELVKSHRRQCYTYHSWKD